MRGAAVTADAGTETPGVSGGSGAESPSPSSSSSPFSTEYRQTLRVDEDTVLETGRFARQSDAAVMASRGGTSVLVTVCVDPEPEMDEGSGGAAASADEADNGFVPLQVHYQERMSAGGRTSSGYNKRDGRPSTEEILTARLIDRPLRPTIPKGWRRETQVLVWVLSYDGENAPDALAVTAAGAALARSSVPVEAAVGAARVGMRQIEGGEPEFILNPSEEEAAQSELDLVVAGTSRGILMIEGYCNFLREETLLAAIEFGAIAIKGSCDAVDTWAHEAREGAVSSSTSASVAESSSSSSSSAAAAATGTTFDEVKTAFGASTRAALEVHSKSERESALREVKDRVIEHLISSDVENAKGRANALMKRLTSATMRSMVVEDGLRSDGRGVSDVRPIECNASVLPRTHGSALFTRGETQSLAVVTLGCDKSAQKRDGLRSVAAASSSSEGGIGTAGENLGAIQRFYLQYFFPPSSVGETGRVGAPSRREIGHGSLAERALVPTLPSEDEFPYTVRVESTILESNGSSSMASVCAGCLAMQDAGVPILRPVAGVAMGLILEKDDGVHTTDDDETQSGHKFVVLTDILGSEDALGDMDFKVAGDEESVTAFQMDIKVEGITVEIMREALARAKEGRQHILQTMRACSPPPRNEMSPYAPRIHRMTVEESDVGTIVGKGGSTIKALCLETGTDVRVTSTGEVNIVGPSQAQVDAAIARIEALTTKPEVNAVYTGCSVQKIMAFGCFVQFLPGVDGLLHISEWDHARTPTMEAACKVGDVVDVKLIEMKNGKYSLSRRALLPAPETEEELVLDDSIDDLIL